MNPIAKELGTQYDLRFRKIAEYRRAVWRVLIDLFFQKLLGRNLAVLDLGCGWGEFINQIQARSRYGIDLNPESATRLDPNVTLLPQDSSEPWPLHTGDIDVVFTSNFLEHLPTKAHVIKTLAEAHRCLRPAGRIICLGPNIRRTGAAYWDFFDHHLPLTELSLCEALRIVGFDITRCEPAFLPYTMASGRQPPLWCVALYLRVPLLWKLAGKQFLVVAVKSGAGSAASGS